MNQHTAPTDEQLGPLPEPEVETGDEYFKIRSDEQVRAIQRDTWARAQAALLASLGEPVSADLLRPLSDVIERLDASIAWLRDGTQTPAGIGVADMIALRGLIRAIEQSPAIAKPPKPVIPAYYSKY